MKSISTGYGRRWFLQHCLLILSLLILFEFNDKSYKTVILVSVKISQSLGEIRPFSESGMSNGNKSNHRMTDLSMCYCVNVFVEMPFRSRISYVVN